MRISGKLASDGLWSLTGSVVSLVAGLAAIRLITRLVSPDAYGAAVLALGVAFLLNGLLIGPFMAVLNRIYFDYRELGLAGWFVRTFRWLCGLAALTTILAYLVVAAVLAHLGEPMYWRVAVPVALLLSAQTYVNALSTYTEAHRLQRRLAMIGVVQKIGVPVFLAALLVASMEATVSVILAQSLALVLVLVLFRAPPIADAPVAAPDSGARRFTTLRHRVLSFGWSLPAGYAVGWVMTTSDRYVIGHFLTVHDVGAYAANYGLWTTPFLVLNGWLEVLTRPIIYQHAARESWRTVRQVIMVRCAAGLGISFLFVGAAWAGYRLLSGWLLSPQYNIGLPIVLVLVAAYGLYVVGNSLIPVFLAAKRPLTVLAAGSVGAAANLTLNILGIPHFGLITAAVTTFIAMLLWCAILAGGASRLLHTLCREETDEPATSALAQPQLTGGIT